MRSPTDSTWVRIDVKGSGVYNAARGARKHIGTDYAWKDFNKDHPVYMPISGTIVRVAKPYANSPLSGVVIESPAMKLKMFYFTPHKHLVKTFVEEGAIIGVGQDIRQRYGKDMIPHIHIEIVRADYDLFRRLTTSSSALSLMKRKNKQ